MTLLEETYRLLDETTKTRPVIAKESGVGFEWLAKFAQRRIANPGVLTVQRLNDYLKRSQITA